MSLKEVFIALRNFLILLRQFIEQIILTLFALGSLYLALKVLLSGVSL